MTIDNCDFWFRTKSGIGFGVYGTVEELSPPAPRFGLLLRFFAERIFVLSPVACIVVFELGVLPLKIVPVVSGFPHPTGGLVIPGDSFDTVLEAEDVGFPHPGGGFVTPALDEATGDFLVLAGTSFAVIVFDEGAGATFGGGV